MTCFWTGILNSLNKSDFQYLKLVRPRHERDFAKLLQKHNTKNTEVTWNDEEISVKQKSENCEAVKELQVAQIGRGYLCSTCDPFLILVAHVFKVNINHRYNGHLISYKVKGGRKLLNFASNRSHFRRG
jgi:hypothetical protein